MVLIILASLLVLGIAFYQAIQGAFSAMVMAILSVLCAAVALNYYEPVAGMLLGRLGAHAHAVALLALFVLPLLALREVFDRVIRGNVVMPLWGDRIGGGAFGLVTAFVLVGVLMVVLQLLPLPASVLTYEPYDANLEVKDGATPRWAGRFALGLAKRFSAGAFRPIGGGQEFGVVHDDLLLDSFCLRNRPPGSRLHTPPNTLEVTDVCLVEMPDQKRLAKLKLAPEAIARLKANVAAIQQATPKYPLISPLAESKVYVVRVAVGEGARDADGWCRLPATHFRLVSGTGKSFYPVAYLTHAGRWRVETALSKDGQVRITGVLVARSAQEADAAKRLLVDWVYRLPAGERPDYLVFRRTAKAPLPPADESLPPVLDRKNRRLALGVASGSKKAEFEPVTRTSLLRPTAMEMRGRIPWAFTVRIPAGTESPEVLKNTVHAASRLQRGVLSCPADEVHKGPVRKARYVSGFAPPSPAHEAIRVDCEVDKEFPAARVPLDTARMNPRLMLDNGQSVPHCGAFVLYGSPSGKQVYLQYDPASAAARTGLDSGFAEALRGHYAKVDQVGLVFVVPADKDCNVVGLSFQNDPSHEFFTVEPMKCVFER